MSLNREEIIKSKSYKVTRAALDWYKGNPDADVIDGFEAGWDACESESIEIIKTAEDHAYFAGSEAMREKLIDKACDAYCKFCGHDSIKSENRKCRQDCGYYKAFKKAMEK